MLLKSLPKVLRRQLVPVPDYAERCLEAMPLSDAPLNFAGVGATLKQLAGIHIPEDAWHPEQLPTISGCAFVWSTGGRSRRWRCHATLRC